MNILVVGAGLTGAVIARELAAANYSVCVIDKRTHIAGNAFDEINQHGIRVHCYGPHLFHTNNQKVVQYLSAFTEWLPYRHKVQAQLEDGRLVAFPPNRETAAIVGEENLLDIFFRPYTRKMWGMELDELNPAVIRRVPVRSDAGTLYFPDDKFQALPKHGYTKMVATMLDHDKITIKLDAKFCKQMEAGYEHIFNCMPIDEYYDFCFGELPYRSIKFEHRHHPTDFVQPVTVVNFTTKDGAMRRTEWKHLPNHYCPPDSGTKKPAAITTLTEEYPCDYRDNHMERYYPVPDVNGQNRSNYQRYAAIQNDKMTFTGRCGNYVYIDMHQAVSMALQQVKQFLALRRKA